MNKQVLHTFLDTVKTIVRLLLLLAGDVSLNPGPGVCGLHLGTVNAHSMRDKAPALTDFTTSNRIDPLAITETWLTNREISADLIEMTPRGFSFQKPKAQSSGGGLGLFVSSAHKFTSTSLPTQTRFESTSCKLGCGKSCLYILNMYRRPGPATTFYSSQIFWNLLI